MRALAFGRAVPAALLLLVAPLAAAGAGAPGQAPSDRVVALFPTQNRAGDASATAAVDEALRRELSRLGGVVGEEETRNALRRRRIRNGDRAAPLLLRQLGADLGAAWLVSATLHDADRQQVPSLTLSARLYSGAAGELLWTGFRGESGLDRRKLLGLGVIASVEALAPLVVRDLLRELPAAADAPRRAGGSRLGTVAVVPFSGSTQWDATRNAESVTAAVVARLFADGARLVSPNRLYDVLRRLQAGRWGGVTAETRAALDGDAGADTILTGTVEAYELGGAESEPEPSVSVALRLLETSTGRIVWTGSEERLGWDREGLFRRGRVHSRGALTEQIVETLTRRLDREGIRVEGRPKGRR
jgi:hypothetical protein